MVLTTVIALVLGLVGSTVYNNTASAYENTCSAPSLQEATKIFGGELKYWSKLNRDTIQYHGKRSLRFIVPNGFILGVPANGGKRYVPGDKFAGSYFYATCVISAGEYVTPRPPTTCPSSEIQAHRQIGGDKENWYFPSMFPGNFPPLVYDAPSHEVITFVVPLHGLVQIQDEVYLPGYLVTDHYLELTCFRNQGWHTLIQR